MIAHLKLTKQHKYRYNISILFLKLYLISVPFVIIDLFSNHIAKNGTFISKMLSACGTDMGSGFKLPINHTCIFYFVVTNSIGFR